MEGSYIETACSNWYSAAWENFPITEEYLQTFDVERPSGDSNQERTEKDDEAIDQIADEEGKRIDEEENENATDDDEKIEIFWMTIRNVVQQRRLMSAATDWYVLYSALTLIDSFDCFMKQKEELLTKFLVYF